MGDVARVLGLLLLASTTVAQSRIQVPPNCGSERELELAIARLLGTKGAGAALPERLRIARTDDVYELELRLRDGARSLRDVDCRALFESAVVMTAAAIQPRMDRAPPPSAGMRPVLQPTLRPPRWQLDATLAVGAQFALLPKAAPLVELAGTLTRGRAGLALAGHSLFRTDERANDAYGASIYGLGGQVAALYAPWPWALVAAGIGADRLSGRGLGNAVEPTSGAGVALAIGLEGNVVLVRGARVSLSLGVAGHYALVRPSFQIDGYGEVYRVPMLGGRAALKLGWMVHSWPGLNGFGRRRGYTGDGS